MTTRPLLTLQYQGGKAGSRYIGKWVASHLPPPTPPASHYVEPFAGMLGVLLQRAPSQTEIVNDTDRNLVNWWRQIRDDPQPLMQKLEWTPYSESLYNDVKTTDWTTQTDLWKAWAYTIILWQGYAGITSIHTAQFGRRQNAKSGPQTGTQIAHKIRRLHHRLARVQIWDVDACDILDRTAHIGHAVIYCDPPYPTANHNTANYQSSDIDIGRLTTTLQAQQGKVAISGYPGEWDHLNWRHHTTTRTTHIHESGSTLTESLWCNYPPLNPTLF